MLLQLSLVLVMLYHSLLVLLLLPLVAMLDRVLALPVASLILMFVPQWFLMVVRSP